MSVAIILQFDRLPRMGLKIDAVERSVRAAREIGMMPTDGISR